MSSPRPRILIIDDSDLARDALSAALREQYAVTEAPSVAAALAALSVAPHGFAAVVLDLRLDAPCAPLHARLALSANAWGEPVPKTREAMLRLAAKGRAMLKRYGAK